MGPKRSRMKEDVVDYLQAELLVPIELDDRYRRAERALLVGAVARAGRPERAAPARLGRFLVHVGERLQASARPRQTAQPWTIWTDPCHGCAN